MDLAKLTSLSSIYYEETNLDFLRPLPQMFSCGVQMICTQLLRDCLRIICKVC